MSETLDMLCCKILIGLQKLPRLMSMGQYGTRDMGLQETDN